uniref:DUF7963 domain-containing protein n=1 Tax=Oryza barthii TaxID=65489 RepID=A0A0D3FTH5_9ORYZ
MSAEEAGGASAEASGSGSAPAGAAMVPGGEEAAARKRYDALMQVRAKAVKGKGAWYWAHLEPVLVPPPGSGVPPKAARLRCVLCAATFSASNPSRTASEHLKRGACPNFAAQQGAAAQPHQAMTVSAASSVVPISSIPTLAADGWREQVVTLSVNLPNGASVFQRAVPTPAPASSDYAEQLMLEAISSVSASSELHHCAGIVADRFGSKALRDLEHKHPWMLNLACQVHGLSRLVRDMARELPLFHSASANCAKMAAYFNAAPTVRALLHKHQVQEHGHAMLLRVAAPPFDRAAAFAMLEDILTSARPLQLAVHEESYKLVCIDDPAAREVGSMVQKVAFWTEVEAAHSLVKLITDMVKEMEAERPLVGQCLPLWEDLRGKVRGWCRKFNVDEGIAMNVVEVRFRKSYHPAWSAAFILDPLYLIKDVSGRYLPPFKYLTPEQDKDVDRLITRLVSPEEAHLALMELMKWRSEGLDPLYAQAVQVRQPDPSTGKMRIANKQSSRLVWETCLSDLKSLGKVAVRLIFLHATAKGFRCAPPMSRWLTAPGSSAAGIARAQRLVYVAANSKLERRDFSNDDDKDVELLTEGDDDMLTEATASVDPSSV